MSRLIVGLVTALAMLAPGVARADYHLISPYEIDLGELEIENNSAIAFDRRPSQTRAASYTLELGTGLTPWWHTEIEFGFNRAPGPSNPTLMDALVTENMFQLTEPGEEFADLGFYIEYGQDIARPPNQGSNQVTFGLAAGKEFGRTVSLLNLFLTRQLGPNQTSQGLDFTYAWQTKWNIWAPLSPAFEIYGDTGTLGSVPGFNRQQLLVGPVGIGVLQLNRLGLGAAGKLKYEAGWLFGVTDSSPRNVLRWRLELEIPF